MSRLLPGQQLPPTTQGRLEAVPCPHCGKTNSFATVASEQLLDTGHEFDCDHCGGMMEVVAITPVTMVKVRKSTRQSGMTRVAQSRPAQQARTLSPAATRKLLKR
jgi:predicted RNA-binding Zn-ribbon protein involved in translation (DUF1610 family)